MRARMISKDAVCSYLIVREQFGAWCGAKGQGEAQEGVEGVRVTEPLVSQRRLALWLALPVDSYPIHA